MRGGQGLGRSGFVELKVACKKNVDVRSSWRGSLLHADGRLKFPPHELRNDHGLRVRDVSCYHWRVDGNFRARNRIAGQCHRGGAKLQLRHALQVQDIPDNATRGRRWERKVSQGIRWRERGGLIVGGTALYRGRGLGPAPRDR